MPPSLGSGSGRTSSFAITDAVGFDDPELAFSGPVSEYRQKALQDRDKHGLVLGTGPEDYNSRVGPRRISLDVGEIQIQGNQDSVFRTAAIEEHRIVRSRKLLVSHSCRFEACFAE